MINTENFYQVSLRDSHIKAISETISKADIKELVACGRLHSEDACPSDIENVLLDAPVRGSWAIVGKYTNRVYAIGGCTLEGCVWFLTSEIMHRQPKRYRVQFLHILKENLRIGLKFISMTNVVWTGNRKHIALLRYLGAIFAGPVTHPNTGEEFIPFTFEKP